MMNLTLNASWVLAILLTSTRIGVVMLLAPVFNPLQGFNTVRLLFTLALAVVLTPADGHLGFSLSVGSLLLAAAAEAFVGFTLAYGVMVAFGAFLVAGKILDVQIGLGLGNVYDPVTRHSSPVLGTLLNMLGLMVFYELDGHDLLIQGLAYSLEHVPLGQGFQHRSAEAIVTLFGLMFSLGVALIAPVMLALLLIEAGLAVLARMLPQMNVFSISTPAKSLGGLMLLALTVPVLGMPMMHVYRSIFEYWQEVLV